jgi:predicted ATPase/transcriptional regulator with XRE-family HTH domain/cytochrome c553
MEAEVSFGTWVSRQRKALDLTRVQLARCVGCSVSGLRKIEIDERRPSRQLAELLAECLQVPPDQRLTFLQVARGQLRAERLATVVPPTASGFVPAHRLPRPASPLPTPPTPLIGREAELTTLVRLLHDPLCRLLTLVGPGGIGKTRLALTVAATQGELLPDGVCFVPLISLTSPEFIVPAVADALGFMFSGPLDPKMQLLNYLREKCLLLVLDGLEHLLEEAGLLAELLLQVPGVKLLVTSRERLNLQAEWLFDLHGLPIPPLDQVDRAEEYGAVALFVQSAARMKTGFVLKTEERPAVVRICQLVEGMPLAIELAAAWVRVLTCAEIEREIEHNLDFLAGAARDTPGQHRSLRATFDHSWHLLSVEERRVLGRLAVFQGGFGREAAEQIADATLPLLLALVSKSLVRRTDSRRYDLHEVVRQYALVRVADEPQAETATRDRHSDFYLALLRDREKALKSAAQQEAIRELTDEIGNVRSAWAWTVKREKFESLGPALRCFGLLFDSRGWYREGIEQLELVVQALQDSSDDEGWQTVLGQALAQEGVLFFRLGWHDQAQNLFEESITILRPTGDPALLLDPLIFGGIVMYLNGQFGRAQSLLDEGLACAQTVDDPWFTALALFNLGYMASCLGSNMESYEQMQAGLAIWRRLGDPRFIALGLNFLCPTAIKLGRLEEAQAFLQESLALCIQVGDRWGMGTAYRCLGLAALAQGDIPEAQCFIHYSLELFTELRARWDVVRSLIYLGEIKAAAGDMLEARRVFLETLPMALEVQAIPVALDALIGLAYLEGQAGQTEQALELSICVSCHSASTQEAKDRAEQLGAELEAQLTPQQLEAVQARTQTKSFDTLVTELLTTDLR